MSLDAYGHYYTRVPPVAYPASLVSSGGVASGSGAPGAGVTGLLYVDIVGNTLYLNGGSGWAAVSGGSGGNAWASGNYSGGQPNFTPSTVPSAAIDTSNNAIWVYYSGAWHNTGLQTS